MNFSEKVLPIMRKVRPLVLPHWGNAKILQQKDSSAFNMVTQFDLDIETFVSEELKKLYPHIGFVGEEGGGDRAANEFWLMDPIDGTAHFIRGLPFCTSMLALVQNGQIVFSVVYDFVTDKMYWAERSWSILRGNASCSE